MGTLAPAAVTGGVAAGARRLLLAASGLVGDDDVATREQHSGSPQVRRREQRERTFRLPIIVLSGRDGEADRIVGLGLGADDYLVKPFSPGELAARAPAPGRHGAARRLLGSVVE